MSNLPNLRRLLILATTCATLSLAGCVADPLDDGLLGAGPDLSQFGATQGGLRAKAKDYFRQANYGLAERTFKAVIAKDSGDGEAWLGLAASYDRLGRFDLADQAYARVLTIAGRRAEIVNNMAWSETLRGHKAKAQALFAEASKLAPTNPVIAANAAAAAKPATAGS